MKNKSEKQRMEELLEGFQQKGEILKKEEESNINEKALEETYKKLQRNAFQKDEQINEVGYSSNGRQYAGSVGETVNSILDTKDDIKYTKFGMGADKMPAVQSGLNPKEALEIAIKRTIESGDPVNNIAFYDEINWNLAKMGFNPKSAMDIKSAMSDMMKYGEIRD